MATQPEKPAGEGKQPDAALQQRVASLLAQARQQLIRNNAAGALGILKEIAGLPECFAEQRLEAAKMLAAASANADAAVCYLNAGLSFLYDHGDLAKARQAFAAAHNLDPHNLDVIFYLGQADIVEGRTQDGLAKFIDVLRKSNLKHTPALFEAGCIYQANGQYDQAILAFKKVLDRDRNHIQAIVHMGQLHQVKGMLPEAINYFMQAAQITREAKQLGTTRQIANMVLTLDPNNPRARNMLADLESKEEEETAPAAEQPATPAPHLKVVPSKAAPSKPEPKPHAASPAQAAKAEPAPQPVRESEADKQAAAAADLQRAEEQRKADEQLKVAQAAMEELQRERQATETALAELRAEAKAKAQQQAEGKAAVQQQQESFDLLVAQRQRAEIELSRVRTDIENAKRERDAALSAAAAKQSEREKNILESLAVKRQTAQRELEELFAKIESARKESETAHLAARTSEQAVEQLEAKLQALNAQVAQVQTEHQNVEQQRTSAASALDQKVRTLETQLATSQAEVAAAKSELASSHAALQGSQKQAAEMRQQLATLQANLADAKAAHDESMRAMETQRGKAQAELDALLHEATQTAKRKDSERERAELSVAELEKKAEQIRSEIAASEAKRKAADAKSTSAQATLASLERQVEEARAKAENATADLKDIMDQARAAQNTSAEFERRLAELQSEIQAGEAKKRSIEESMGKMKPLIAAADKRRTEAENAALQAEKLRQQRESELEASAAKTGATEEKLKAAQASLADMENRLAELQPVVQAAEAKKRSIEESMGKMKPLVAAADKRRTEAENAAQQAEKLRAKRESELEAVAEKASATEEKLKEAQANLRTIETRKREIEESFNKAKSLTAAAEQRRNEAEAGAEKAEAIRTKREADAEALAARIAALESSIQQADARAKSAASQARSLEALSAEAAQKRSELLELQTARSEKEAALAELRKQVEAAQHELAAAQEQLTTAQSTIETQTRRPVTADIDAQAVVAVVPAETCVESLRTIESLAADGELPIEIATELASLIHEGRAAQALREARKHANLEAEPGAYLLVSGDLCRDLGDIEGAREAYNTLAIAEPKKAPLAHTRTGELFLAFAERSTAAALQRDDAHFAASQDPAKALETYADLVARFPDDPHFREELGTVHERLGNETAAALAFNQAMTGYLGDDEVSRAVELVPKMLAVHPNDGSAFELASRAFERAGRQDDAVSMLDRALRSYQERKAASDVERVCRRLAEIAPDPVPYRQELASLLRDAGDADGAAEQLLEAADKLIAWSRGSDAQKLLKQVEQLSGNDPAMQERVTALSAQAADAQRSVDDVARGDLLLSKGQPERAVESYRRALDENPHHAGAAYQLACLLMDHFQEYEEAEALLQISADQRPDHAATRYRLALVKAARGEVVEAVELLIALARFDESHADFIDQFAERLEKDAESGNVGAKYRLGIAYRELGRVDEALVILQSIQRQTDYVVLCHNAIGLCLRRQGLETAAAKRFTKAIETPGYPEVQYHEALYNLGDLYEAKDTPESLALALSSFEELYASDCTFKDIADRIKGVKARLGATERPKVKRLPTRSMEQA